MSWGGVERHLPCRKGEQRNAGREKNENTRKKRRGEEDSPAVQESLGEREFRGEEAAVVSTKREGTGKEGTEEGSIFMSHQELSDLGKGKGKNSSNAA